MPTEVILPRVDMDMTEGSIAAWHVAEGDEVRAGTVIFEIETSKATMEVDAPASGVIRQISAAVGDVVPVGTAVAWIYAVDEVVQDAPRADDVAPRLQPDAPRKDDVLQSDGVQSAQQDGSRRDEVVQAALPVDDAESSLPQAPAPSSGTEPVRATPAARRLARERGLQLVSIAGSGPHGRIAAQDVLRSATTSDAASHLQAGSQMLAPNGSIARDARNESSASNATNAQHTLHTIWLQRGVTGSDTLVLLHGFAAESNSWRPFANALKRLTGDRVSVCAVDLPAHGKSSDAAAGSLDAIVAAVDHTLRAEGITRCHLLGHSFGGAIALAMAAAASRPKNAAPLPIDSLTLLAPAGFGPESNGAFLRGVTTATRRASLAPWLRQLFADPARMDEGFLATAAQQLERADIRERLAAVADRFFPDGTQSLDLRERLATLTMPVRLVWGLQDRILPARHADGVPGRIAVHRFGGVGHLPQVEALDDVVWLVATSVLASTDTESALRRVAIR